ncbi:hypothetical protein LZ198_38345 [Myxococcus sp. K15C18031901]|uniref:hypothetical protein n=1 Tax=Myxococcus dinghuensis TaxID=2906761 RepID=UPI0020A76626|nr:hypothetical protein [Myxococcus dinghuensis]MCP3104743.1 hypothetical protein [Myxococcus dinghuensis]
MVTIPTSRSAQESRSLLAAQSVEVGRTAFFWPAGGNWGGPSSRTFQSLVDGEQLLLRRQATATNVPWFDTYLSVRFTPRQDGSDLEVDSHARFQWAGTLGLAALCAFFLSVSLLAPGPVSVSLAVLTGVGSVRFWRAVRGRREADLRWGASQLRTLLDGRVDGSAPA